MVRALLDGSKTQTRRVVKPQPSFFGSMTDPNAPFKTLDAGLHCQIRCPYGPPGDRLWVRETFLVPDQRASTFSPWVYAADYGEQERPQTRWKPSIHMPRAASRITLEVTGVRVERLQDISRGDAMDEGCPFPNMAQGDDPRKWYADLWKTINGDGSWDANPFVWVVVFKVVKP
jgi:hypothetical protein